MDPLTPNKIQRLINLAEDKSFNNPRSDLTRLISNQAGLSSTAQYESSSGILDLDRVEGFGESMLSGESMCKSTAFNPGEMTGRSTEADNMSSKSLGRHSLGLDSITNQMNKQTNEVADIMRHSIAADYSFHSKPNLTADEASLVRREAPIPIAQTTQTHFTDSLVNNSNLSVGAYFQNRCLDFNKILGKTDSPDRSALSATMPSITEVSSITPIDPRANQMSHNYKMDESLDCVPVRQSRNEVINKNADQNPIQNYKRQSIQSTAISEKQEYSRMTDVYCVENVPSVKKSDQHYVPKTLNPATTSFPRKAFTSSTPTHLLLKNLQASLKIATEDTEGSAENSLSLSKIADYLGKQSSVSVTDMIHYNQKKTVNKKQPLTELHINMQEKDADENTHVTNLRDVRKMETASSAGTLNTVISRDKVKINEQKEVPTLLVTEHALNDEDDKVKLESARPKSPGNSQLGRPKSPGNSQLGRPKSPGNSQLGRPKSPGNSQLGRPKSPVNSQLGRPKSPGNNQLGRPKSPGNSQLGRPKSPGNKSQLVRPKSPSNKTQSVRSKSPSSKSQSTLSTVQENFTSFKSGDSPVHNSRGEINASRVPSPNIEYRELDKSVDWHEVLLQKQLRQKSLVKEQWAEVSLSPVDGFVGVSSVVIIAITNLTENWLTAKFEFNLPADVTIELPRLPLLLTPGKTEQHTAQFTSNVEITDTLLYKVFIKDASIDEDIAIQGNLDVNIKMPIIQAMCSDGVNKVAFPLIQESSSLIKSFVLISDCPADLQLDLTIGEGDGVFAIKTVQEIKRSDVNKVLMDRQGTIDEQKKGKGLNKQLCRLSTGNAIRVTVKFNAPKLSESQIEVNNVLPFNGTLNVNIIGVSTVLRKVDLVGNVGMAKLIVEIPQSMHKLHLTNEPTTISLRNVGFVSATWIVKLANNNEFPFKVLPSKFDIPPRGSQVMALAYIGSDDWNKCKSATIYLEDIVTGNKTPLEISGGSEKPKCFPIKTNHSILSWVTTGRKELSLKNSSEKKIHVRCYMSGEGFAIDLPGLESRGIFCLPFGPNESRILPVIFAPTSNLPHSATLHLANDKSNDFSRKIKLYGCASGEAMRWSGLVTYGDTALVRAVSREPIVLELYNKASTPAFVSARVHFNLQYTSVSSSAQLLGGRRIVPARSKHALRLSLEWTSVERRAQLARTPALATLVVLTGPEITRRRILKVLRNESNGDLDTSLLDDHLKVLAGQFEGEDPNTDNLLAEFNENKSSLNELIGGLHELSAQIVLPQDFADDNTIIIADDTIIEHHTLCD